MADVVQWLTYNRITAVVVIRLFKQHSKWCTLNCSPKTSIVCRRRNSKNDSVIVGTLVKRYPIETSGHMFFCTQNSITILINSMTFDWVEEPFLSEQHTHTGRFVTRLLLALRFSTCIERGFNEAAPVKDHLSSFANELNKKSGSENQFAVQKIVCWTVEERVQPMTFHLIKLQVHSQSFFTFIFWQSKDIDFVMKDGFAV